MEQYTVTGMSCAACSARVEKAVSKVPGVKACAINLLTNSMGVEGNVAESDIIKAVENAGYGAIKKNVGENTVSENKSAEEVPDKETIALRNRLLASVGFLLVLMYFSMGHMMWEWPVPAFFAKNHVAMGLLQMLLTISKNISTSKTVRLRFMNLKIK